jgi:hypothetical protein
MDWLFSGFGDWMKDGLIEAIVDSYSGIFDEINTRLNSVADDVGQTPQDWNPSVFEMIKNLSDTVITPIAGIILTFVLCYELITMIVERNNLHSGDTFELFKWIMKSACAVVILTHTFDIVMGTFELAQEAVTGSAGLVGGNISTGSGAALDSLKESLNEMPLWSIAIFYLEIFVVKLSMQAMSIAIFILVYGRMIEIYCVSSVAPIPFATMANREWGQIGNNYLKSLVALAFQGFLIIVCVSIYSVLSATIPVSDNVHAAIWSRVGYTVLLCIALFKTGSLAKSIFGAR